MPSVRGLENYRSRAAASCSLVQGLLLLRLQSPSIKAPREYTQVTHHRMIGSPGKHDDHAITEYTMKKRCFPRYDTRIDARYCTDDATRDWRACLITKISRKGLGVVFPETVPPLPNAILTLSLPIARDAEALILQGTIKWVKPIDGRHAGGVELNTLVDEARWLQLIYHIRQPAAEKQLFNLPTMPPQGTANQHVHPAPAKVVLPTTGVMTHLKNILNYKII
jgi:hypothetical protein